MSHEGIVKSIQKGINFLSIRQLPSGEFATMKWQKPDMHSASYERSVFITSFVLHSLRHVASYALVGEIGQRAIEFLLEQMEQNGLWRFGGRNSYIHFDIDDTCCVLASLKEWGVELDYYSQAMALLKYRDNQGLFYTWILDIDSPFEKDYNNIDWVVNANALFFYSLLNHPLPEVEQYLNQVVKTGAFHQRSPYYESPCTFIYCLTRAYADGCNSGLYSAIAKAKAYLIFLKERNNTYGDPLQDALSIVGLLNCTDRLTAIEQAIGHLVSMQEEDGGWPIGIFFTGGPYTEYRIVYGSRELTTGIAIEAMSKYLMADKVNGS